MRRKAATCFLSFLTARPRSTTGEEPEDRFAATVGKLVRDIEKVCLMDIRKGVAAS
jgi:hypothetical protein